MDIIQKVVQAENDQVLLVQKTKDAVAKKLEQKSADLEKKFLEKKQSIIKHHEEEFAKLKASFAKKKVPSPSFSIDKKVAVKEAFEKIKWQLKK